MLYVHLLCHSRKLVTPKFGFQYIYLAICFRVEAIQRQETSTTLRKSSMSPYDDQILQQKQLLRTPSKEDYLGSASPKRNESSKEIGNSGNGTAMWLATTTTEQTKSRYQEKAERDQEAKLDFDNFCIFASFLCLRCVNSFPSTTSSMRWHLSMWDSSLLTLSL